MQVLIVGAGRVGLANAWYLATLTKNKVHVYDQDPDVIEKLRRKINIFGKYTLLNLHSKYINIDYHDELPDINDRLAIIFCIDLGENANYILDKYKQKYGDNIYLAVLRGTMEYENVLRVNQLTEKLVCFPEFLSEGNEEKGVVSTVGQNFIAPFDQSLNGIMLIDKLRSLYDFPQDIDYTICRPAEAFGAKIWTNAFLALKVTVANTIQMMYGSDGFDHKLICEMVGEDPRIGRAHLKPGPGYGGSCLPYAVDALSYEGFGLFREVEHLNNANINFITDSLRGIPTLFFGFNFKGNGVLDTRNSAQLQIIKRLGKDAFVTDNQYHADIGPYWAENPAEAFLKVDRVVIFYETHWVRAFEDGKVQGISVDDWRSKIVWDFR